MTLPAEPRAGAARRTPAVLVVDDEQDLRELVALTLVRLGLDVDVAESVTKARELLGRGSYALCLTDMRLPDGTGLDLVRDIAHRSGTRVAVITAYGSAENAVAALKAGAFDYLTKPVDLDQLRALVRSALRGVPGPADAVPAAGSDGPAAEAIGRLVGESGAMRQLRAMVGRLAQSMAPVAILGESGSGKELVARAIHDTSPRRDLPFVAVNCGAIPESLMEAEFFGYRKGAFTGADRDREGFFQAASGGTLFLDEVAELPLPMQVKLLRAIQERRVRRVGSTQEESIDARILSATHQDLVRLVASGRFRQDLFYRLNVIELRVPSLRERTDDIGRIAAVILDRVVRRAGAGDAWLSEPALQALQRYPFPGNVRELENVLERAVAMAGGGELQPVDLMLPGEFDLLVEPEPPADDPGAAAAGAAVAAAERLDPAAGAAFTLDDGVPSNLPAWLDALERDAIKAALSRTNHNRTAAAQRLGITFRQMRYRMQRLGLK